MDDKQLDISVSYHPGGRYTLVEKSGRQFGQDVLSENLTGCDDAAAFYRAVAQRIADRVSEGFEVRYRDTTLDSKTPK